MEYDKPISKSNLRDDLKMTFEPGGRRGIELAGQRIGGLVHYGKHVGFDRKKVKTVYASRIYQDGLKIEVEASNPSSVLDKVASELARQMKAKKAAEKVVKVEEQTPDNEPSSPKI
jgi:ribosomal protein L20A (L18A)